ARSRARGDDRAGAAGGAGPHRLDPAVGVGRDRRPAAGHLARAVLRARPLEDGAGDEATGSDGTPRSRLGMSRAAGQLPTGGPSVRLAPTSPPSTLAAMHCDLPGAA